MKQKYAAALALSAAVLLGAAALAVDAGSAEDPFISLEWLKNSFTPKALSQAQERVDAKIDKLGVSSPGGWDGGVEVMLKRGDVLRLETGSGIVPLAGEFACAASGTVVDTTAGASMASGAALAGHSYLVAEKTSAAFSVVTDTAVARLSGPYAVSLSEQTDYNALADALRVMGLFRGTDTPYGRGYDLEQAPTRIQGLILFLRLIGEEKDALAYSGSPAVFADVPEWALPYAAYAYSQGYAKGVGKDQKGQVCFAPDTALMPNDYVTFLLRALKYTEGTDFNWLTASADAAALGILTKGELNLLAQGTSFLRSQTVYLSYYALCATVKGEGRTLLDRLEALGTVDAQTAAAAMAAVTGKRL